MPARVVTIHAPYGAGGGIVGPKVAEALGVPFLDRAIPATVAHSLAVPLAEALAHDERAETGLGRILAAMTPVGPLGMLPEGAVQGVITEKAFREQAERLIREMADTTGGVILGRAGMIVLAGRPSTLHLCLDGTQRGDASRCGRGSAATAWKTSASCSWTPIGRTRRTTATSTGPTPSTRSCTT